MMPSMRTTVTLEDDVAALLRQAMARRGTGFKEALNEALRIGLTGATSRPQREPFRQVTFHMGFDPRFRWDKAMSMASDIEDEELAHKLQLRK